MAKKVKSKQKQKQKQRQSQSVKVVVNLAKPKTKRRRRAAPREPAMMAAQQMPLPPVVYQVPTPITFYGQPDPVREQSLVNVGLAEKDREIQMERERANKLQSENKGLRTNIFNRQRKDQERNEADVLGYEYLSGLADENISINTMDSIKTGEQPKKTTAKKSVSISTQPIYGETVGNRVSKRHQSVREKEKEREKELMWARQTASKKYQESISDITAPSGSSTIPSLEHQRMAQAMFLRKEGAFEFGSRASGRTDTDNSTVWSNVMSSNTDTTDGV